MPRRRFWRRCRTSHQTLQSVLSARGDPALDPRSLPAMAGGEGATLDGPRAYRIAVEAELPDGRRRSAEVVILLLESGDEPYRVLSWRNASDGSTAPQRASTNLFQTIGATLGAWTGSVAAAFVAAMDRVVSPRV